MDIWVIFHILAIMDMLVLFLSGHTFSILLGVYLVEELLNHIEARCVAFGGTARVLPEVSAPLYIPPAGKGVLISPNPQQCSLSVFRIVAIPMGVH